jgi:hypothetical protein
LNGVATLTKEGARWWDAGTFGRSEVRDALIDAAAPNSVKVHYKGREVTKLYPRRENPKKRRKKNPAPPSYSEFHGGRRPADRSVSVGVGNPKENDFLIECGVLPDIPYSTVKGVTRGTWEHLFRKPRPRLAYGNKDGKLYIVGGQYKITAAGIVG